MIENFIATNFPSFINIIAMCAVMFALVFIGVIIDLCSGIIKAIRSDVQVTSWGLRSSVVKAIQYFSIMAFTSMIDLIISVYTSLPYLTMATTIGLLLIEGKSVYERSDDKYKKQLKREIGYAIELLSRKDIQGVINKIGELEEKNKKSDK